MTFGSITICLSTNTSKMFFVACCWFSLYCPLLGTGTSTGGMYKCRGLCWVGADMQVWSCCLATMGSGGLDLDARGLDLGSYTSLLLTKNSKKALELLLQCAK